MKKFADKTKHLFFLFLSASICGSLLQLSLYLRSSPYATPFVLDVNNYVFHAVYYEWYGNGLVVLPFFLFHISLGSRQDDNWKDRLYWTAVILLFTSLVLRHIDNELQRYMGTHLSIDFVRTYGNIKGMPASIWQSFALDAGGKYLTIVLFSVPAAFFCSALYIRKSKGESSGLLAASMTLSLVAFLLLPFLFWNVFSGGGNRRNKVKPPVILLFEESIALFHLNDKVPDLVNKIELVQKRWKEADGSKKWEFVSAEYPFYKRHQGPCPELPMKPNIIVIILETFRAMDMKLYNPVLNENPTPFLDELAKHQKSGYWTRLVANGTPTAFSFMTVNTSMIPHSTKTAATDFSRVEVDSLSSKLGKHGYHSSYFCGSDPDWDNQRHWLKKWYDYVYYKPENMEKDRLVFRDAASYLKDPTSNRPPFLAVISSISNHYSFNNPEPALNINSGTTVRDKLHNTMHYDDEVIREFFDSIRDASWYKDTIFIITGDHGYDLGERGSVIGHTNLRHETNWVPFIMHSENVEIPRGRNDAPASHIDLAPTLMELAGVCDSNSFMGHSLISKNADFSYSVSVKDRHYALEDNHHSFYLPSLEKTKMFLAADVLQKQDVSFENPELVRDAEYFTRSLSEVADYLYGNNLIKPVE